MQNTLLLLCGYNPRFLSQMCIFTSICTNVHLCLGCLICQAYKNEFLHAYIFRVIEPYLHFEISDGNMPSMYHTHFCLLIKPIFYNYSYLDNLEP